jgi:outer membrane receptor protein involved in Fe transport
MTASRIFGGLAVSFAILCAAQTPPDGILSPDSKAEPSPIDSKAQGLPPFVITADRYKPLGLPTGNLGLLPVLIGAVESPPNLNMGFKTGRVITPMRMDQLPERVAADVDLVASTAREAGPTVALGDALRVLPNFVAGRRSDTLARFASRDALSLRVGAAGNHGGGALALLDGVPLNDPFDGSVDWSKVPGAALDHIELVSGGGATAWGNDAGNGVMQLFIPPPALQLALIDQPPAPMRTEWRGTLQVTAIAGDFDTRSGSLALVRPFESGLLQVLGEQFSTGGAPIIAPEDRGPLDVRAWSRHRSVLARWSMPIGKKLDLVVTARAFETTAGDGTPLATHAAREAFVSGAVNVQATDAFSWSALMFVQRGSSSRTLSLVDEARHTETPLVREFAVPTGALGATWAGTWADADGGRTLAGMDFRASHGESRQDVGVGGGALSHQQTAGASQTMLGLFLLREKPVADDWRVAAGGRIDRWSNESGHSIEVDHATGLVLHDDRAAPHAGLEPALNAGFVWHALDGLRIRAHIQRGFRLPTIEECYRHSYEDGRILAPNPALDPEDRTTAEIGARWSLVGSVAEAVVKGPGSATSIFRRRTIASARATVFWTDIRDLITGVAVTGAGGPSTPGGAAPAGWGDARRVNLDRAQAVGVELSGDFQPTTSLSLSGRFLYDDATIRLASAAPWLNRNRLAQSPVVSGSVTATWRAPGSLVFTPRVRWIGREWQDAENTLRLGEAVVVDLGVGRPLTKNLDLFLELENIGNARVETGCEAGRVRALGTPRFAFGGVRGHW